MKANENYNAKFFYAGDVAEGIGFTVNQITNDTVAAATAIRNIGPTFNQKFKKDATAVFDYGAITLPDIIVEKE